MFYSRSESRASLLRFILMFLVALGCALYFLATDTAYDRAGVMLVAAVLCAGNLLWKVRRFESADAVEELLGDVRSVWSSE